MTRTLIIESGQKPTEEQLKEIEEAKKVLSFLMRIAGNYQQPKAFKSAVVHRNRKKEA